jgi:hypothetical protein
MGQRRCRGESGGGSAQRPLWQPRRGLGSTHEEQGGELCWLPCAWARAELPPLPRLLWLLWLHPGEQERWAGPAVASLALLQFPPGRPRESRIKTSNPGRSPIHVGQEYLCLALAGGPTGAAPQPSMVVEGLSFLAWLVCGGSFPSLISATAPHPSLPEGPL